MRLFDENGNEYVVSKTAHITEPGRAGVSATKAVLILALAIAIFFAISSDSAVSISAIDNAQQLIVEPPTKARSSVGDAVRDIRDEYARNVEEGNIEPRENTGDSAPGDVRQGITDSLWDAVKGSRP